MSEYFFTTAATLKKDSHNKPKSYLITGYKIETDSEGHPTAKGWEQAASLMNVYCDTDYESSRYLFIKKDGTILCHLSFSNGVPNSTRPYPSIAELNEIREYAQNTDSKIIFFHNHPNGFVEPSEPDVKLTEKFKSLFSDNLQKERFLGHIILDTGSGTYGFYDTKYPSWSIHYNNTLHSFNEYYEDIRNGNLLIVHNSDPERRTFRLPVGEKDTVEKLAEIESLIHDDSGFYTKEDYIPVWFLKEYGVIEHLEYIHVSSFLDYDNLDKKLRSLGSETGTTRCYMFPSTYEQYALCANYAEKTIKDPVREKEYKTGIIDGILCTEQASKKVLFKIYNRSLFDGMYNPHMKIRDDSRDYPLGIEMNHMDREPASVKVNTDVLVKYSKKHSLWPLNENQAKSYLEYLNSIDLSLSFIPETNSFRISGKTEGTVFQKREEIDFATLTDFIYENSPSIQYQKTRNVHNLNSFLEKESVNTKEYNMADIKEMDKSTRTPLFSEEDFRISIAHEIKVHMPNLSDSERAAALAILEAGAKSFGKSLSDYVANTFPHGIFGDVNILNSQNQSREEIHGAVDVRGFGENVSAVIYASKSADFSTWVHEVAHIWQAQLTGKLKEDAEQAFQVENGDWRNSIYTFADGTQDTCGEAFAYGFEDFLKHKAGEMAAEDKKQIFEKFADYMSLTYNGISENIEISDEIAEVYNAFVALDDNLLSQAEKAVQEEKQKTIINEASESKDVDKENLQYQIVGESSIRKMASSMEKNRILQNLKAAVLLDEKIDNISDESKASRIRMETGWEKAVDGSWKYETDDSLSYIKNGAAIQKLLNQDAQNLTKIKEGIPLKNILDAPELFSIFPFMQYIKVHFYDELDTYRGSLSSDGIMINTHYLKDVNGEKGFKGILAHEIQHIIQAVEYTGKTQLENEDVEMLYMETMKALKENGTKFYDYDVNSVNKGIADYIKNVGEIEARNVARRIAYSATERLHKTLQSTEDVSRNLQFQGKKRTDNKEILKLRNLNEPELIKTFKNEQYFILYNKVFIPYRKIRNEEELALINNNITNDNMIVTKPKNTKAITAFSYDKKAFDSFSSIYNTDIFYCVDDNRFCIADVEGLKNLNVSKLRRFYADELIKFNKENTELLSKLKVLDSKASVIKNELKPALINSAIALKIIPFTRENYNILFPMGLVESPIETVKLGENQFDKLDAKNRQKYLDLVYQTLRNPSVIINSFRLNNGKEELSHNYIKSYIDESNIEGFQSIIVTIDDNNISISSHRRDLDNILSKIKTPEQVNYINSEVGHLIEHLVQYSELQVVNPTRNLFPAIESAYDTDITGVSNPYYDESEDLSTLIDNLQFQKQRNTDYGYNTKVNIVGKYLRDNHPELLEEIRTSGTEEQKTVVESFINADSKRGLRTDLNKVLVSYVRKNHGELKNEINEYTISKINEPFFVEKKSNKKTLTETVLSQAGSLKTSEGLDINIPAGLSPADIEKLSLETDIKHLQAKLQSEPDSAVSEKLAHYEQKLKLTNVFSFDTETTGFAPPNDELLQISVVNGNGTEVFNHYVKPQHNDKWPFAQKVNHISPKMVKDCPSVKEYVPQLQKIFDNAELLVSYNGRFDVNFLEDAGIKIDENKPHLDVIKSFSEIYGQFTDSDKKAFNGYKYQKLTTAADYYGLQIDAHNSIGDCISTLDVAKKIYGTNLEKLTPEIISSHTIDEPNLTKINSQEKKMININASDFIKELEGYTGTSKEAYKGLIDYVYNRSAIQNSGRENSDDFDMLFNTFIAPSVSSETARNGLYEKIKEYKDKNIIFDADSIDLGSVALSDNEGEQELYYYLSELKDSYNTLVSNLQENRKSPVNEQTIQNNNQLWTDAHLRKEFIDKIRAEMESPEMSYDDFYNLVGKVSEEYFTDEQRETLNKMILDMSETDNIEEGIKHLQNRVETDIAIDNGALWEYNDKHEKVLNQDGSYHVDYFNNIPVQQLTGENLSNHLIKSLSETPRLENEQFIDFFNRVTYDYTVSQKKELNSLVPPLVNNEPGDDMLSKLESYINNREKSVSESTPSLTEPSQASPLEPVQSEGAVTASSEELRYTYTPEVEKEDYEQSSFEKPDHIVSESEEKEPEHQAENKPNLSYKEFLVMASQLQTPEEYESFFQENFHFKEAAIKQIPPIADNRAQLFVENKPTKLVIDYNDVEVGKLANWCLVNGMAFGVPHPEDVRQKGVGLIQESLQKLNKILGTDIQQEVTGQSQSSSQQDKTAEQSQSVNVLPQLYEGSQWSEEELKLIKHVEMDKIPEFISDPYKTDVAVPRFGMCLPDPETGEYKMQEQTGWHFAQKEIQNGCVSAILLTKVNESGVREFLKIDPVTYEAAINRNKELMEAWSKPRFKESHIKALYEYENSLGISKTETRSNTCAQYFHNFEAACRGAEGYEIAHNETEAMEHAKNIYLKMTPHEKSRMHQMEKDWEKVHGTSFHEELLRRFYEVRKDMQISQEQMRYAGHELQTSSNMSQGSLVSKASLEDGKILGELDDISRKKIGDSIKISLKAKDYNGRFLNMPATEMTIAGANKATNTVLLVDPEKNTEYQLPLDKFISFCQKQELKHTKEQRKEQKTEMKTQNAKQKKDIEDYGFDR